MDLPFELFIAVRYLLARRKQAFISLISLISILGVTVGVMALLIALALMTGLQGELRDRIVGSAAHVYVFKAGGIDDYEAEIAKLKGIPHVLGAAPVSLGQAMITGPSSEQFVTLKGIVPELEPNVTRIAESMQKGSLTALDTPQGTTSGIVIGAGLATKLGTFVGDTLQVMTPHGTLTPGGLSFAPKPFKVVGLFTLGLLEFDEAYAFVEMSAAERMLGKDQPDYIQLRVDDLWKAQAVADSVTERLGSQYMPQDWADMNQALFSALALEKLAISVTIGLIVMVAALNIVASLVLLVMEKSRDIAILKTMGSSAASIRRIFMFQGLVIGSIGTIGGAVFGGLTIFLADRYKLVRVPVDVYQISYVPFRLEALDFVVVIASAVLICFIATIYPSRQASKLDPAQALRYQ
ncbi:MAG: ABC transporter permease [Vicinamibacterales bacterium]